MCKCTEGSPEANQYCPIDPRGVHMFWKERGKRAHTLR